MNATSTKSWASCVVPVVLAPEGVCRTVVPYISDVIRDVNTYANFGPLAVANAREEEERYFSRCALPHPLSVCGDALRRPLVSQAWRGYEGWIDS